MVEYCCIYYHHNKWKVTRIHLRICNTFFLSLKGDLEMFVMILSTTFLESLQKLDLVNGVLFTGGSVNSGLYFETVGRIFKVCFVDGFFFFFEYMLCLWMKLWIWNFIYEIVFVGAESSREKWCWRQFPIICHLLRFWTYNNDHKRGELYFLSTSFFKRKWLRNSLTTNYGFELKI